MRLKYDSNTRFCKRGHDTHRTGRYAASNNCVACHKNAMRQRNRSTRALRLQAAGEIPEPVPGLWALRRRKGYTVEQLAWECHNLGELQISMIEAQTRHATYHERVEIFQAFNVLDAKRLEEKEAEMEQAERLKRAGVA